MIVHQRNSPNFNTRPRDMPISLIVLHADAAKSITSSLSWILSRNSRVSYHYMVGRFGHVYQCVDDVHRAWHAGVSAYAGVKGCNDYSVGVCISNDQVGEKFTDAAIESAARICATLMTNHPDITIDRIVTHAEVALPKGRKHDPGPLFPMQKFLDRVRHYKALDDLPPAPDPEPEPQPTDD